MAKEPQIVAAPEDEYTPPKTYCPEVEPVDSENTADVDVPLSSGKGGCYTVGDDGRRVRVAE